MKNIALNSALGLVALGFVGWSDAAFATTYDFRYLFGGDGAGKIVTGEFTGTGGLDDISVTGVVNMALNGAAVAGPLFAWSYIGPQGASNSVTYGGAVVSADSSKSNFVFSTASQQAGFTSSTTYFYVFQPWINPPGSSSPLAAQYYDGSKGTYINNYNGQYAKGNFSVSAVPAPEAGTGLMGLGLAALGFVGLRKAKKSGFVGFRKAEKSRALGVA